MIIALLGMVCGGYAAHTIQASGLAITQAPPTQAPPDIGITLAPTVRATSPTCETPQTSADPPIRYEAEATLDLLKHTVTGTLVTHYRNTTEAPLTSLLFYIPLADRPNAFSLVSLSTTPVSTTTDFQGLRLTVTLAAPLPSGCTVQVRMAYRIVVPPIPEGAEGGFGFFGYSERQTNLGDWLPTLAPHIDGGWLIPKAWYIGETRITEAASYAVTIKVTGASSPARLDVAGPGDVTRLGADSWQFKVDHARNFALSVSDSFIHQSATTPEGTLIDLYRFAAEAGSTAPVQAFTVAQDASTVFTRLFGALPIKRLAVVQADFPDGMEFSGIVFVSTQWFTRFWLGKPDSWLTIITAHEVAHQWWYSSVGDDQSRHPYLDETFAIYSEVIYLEDRYPELVKWWWKWRIEQYKPSGFVDTSVYDYTQGRLYINAVYLRGAQMMQELRDVLGEAAFFGWLRRYAERGAGQIVEPKTLWGLLTAEDYAKTVAVRAKYLKVPDVVR